MRTFAILAVLCSLVACKTPGGSASRTSRAPDFITSSIDGRSVRLSTFLGKKVVLMNFWATWCGPCMKELPHLEALYQKYKDQGLEVVAIAMDDASTVSAVTSHARQMGLTFTVLTDLDSKATTLYNPAKAQPFNVFIDRSGKVVGTKEGYEPGDELEIEKKIQALLQ